MTHIHIALVGREALPVYYTVAEYKPELTYLIGTRETRTAVKNLQAVMSVQGLNSRSIDVSPYDVEQTMAKCADIHAANGEAEYSYNLTGGTKPMAIGAMLCAQRHGARMLYTDAASILDLATFEHAPLATKLDNKTLFALQGQRLKSYDVFTPDEARRECAKEIGLFIRKHKAAYGTLMQHYQKHKQVPREFEQGKTLYRKEGRVITVEHKDVEVLCIDHPDAHRLLFEGRWWETLVAEAIHKWAAGRYELWTNVKFQPTANGASKDKNEVDVLLNVGNTLLFVECKSGAFDQNNIYKLESVCQTYGGYKSRGVIIAFQRDKVNADLKEKAHDRKIEIIVPDAGLANLGVSLERFVKSLKA